MKLKNRLVHQLSEIDSQISANNSTVEGNSDYDVRILYRQRLVAAERLVQLKVQISQANQGVQKEIFELAECKALIAMLRRVNTRHGSVVEGYSGTCVTYHAQFRKPEIDREIRRVEQEMDRLQDMLDQFNHRTTIILDASYLADAQENAARG